MLRRFVLVMTVMASVPFLVAPAQASHDPTCSDIDPIFDRPSTLLNNDQPITFGASVSCTRRVPWLRLEVWLQKRGSFGSWNTVKILDVTRHQTSGFTATDTYDPGEICSLTGNGGGEWRLWTWTTFLADDGTEPFWHIEPTYEPDCSPGIG